MATSYTTEAEAKQRWCSWSRVNTGVGVPINRGEPAQLGYPNCIGSKCMAWRWDKGSDTLGYCGNSGIPEE